MKADLRSDEPSHGNKRTIKGNVCHNVLCDDYVILCASSTQL